MKCCLYVYKDAGNWHLDVIFIDKDLRIVDIPEKSQLRIQHDYYPSYLSK